LSGCASELEADALSVELEQLAQQVEQERQRLATLQQQRQQLEEELTASQTNLSLEPQQQEEADATCGQHTEEASGAARPQAEDAAGAVGTSPAAEAGAAATSTVATPPAAADAASQTEDTAKAAAAAAGVAAPANTAVGDTALRACCVDAACQASLLETAGLPAVGPPASCRLCPAVQQQLLQLQQKLENAQEQEKQVGFCQVPCCRVDHEQLLQTRQHGRPSMTPARHDSTIKRCAVCNHCIQSVAAVDHWLRYVSCAMLDPAVSSACLPGFNSTDGPYAVVPKRPNLTILCLRCVVLL
jgi:hypothetical protein